MEFVYCESRFRVVKSKGEMLIFFSVRYVVIMLMDFFEWIVESCRFVLMI